MHAKMLSSKMSRKKRRLLCKSHHGCIMCQLIALQSIQAHGCCSPEQLCLLWPPDGAWLPLLQINISEGGVCGEYVYH